MSGNNKSPSINELRQQLAYNAATIGAQGSVLTRPQKKELRQRHGFCTTCEGPPILLYKIKNPRLPWLGKDTLTTHGECQNGICFVCHPEQNPNRPRLTRTKAARAVRHRRTSSPSITTSTESASNTASTLRSSKLMTVSSPSPSPRPSPRVSATDAVSFAAAGPRSAPTTPNKELLGKAVSKKSKRKASSSGDLSFRPPLPWTSPKPSRSQSPEQKLVPPITEFAQPPLSAKYTQKDEKTLSKANFDEVNDEFYFDDKKKLNTSPETLSQKTAKLFDKQGDESESSFDPSENIGTPPSPPPPPPATPPPPSATVESAAAAAFSAYAMSSSSNSSIHFQTHDRDSEYGSMSSASTFTFDLVSSQPVNSSQRFVKDNDEVENAIEEITTLVDDLRTLGGESDFLAEILIRTMKEHPLQERVQDCCIGFIWDLSKESNDNKTSLLNANASDEIIKAMNSFPHSSSLQEKACAAIWSLGMDDNDRKILIQAGACECVMNTLQLMIDNERIARTALGALRTLSAVSVARILLVELDTPKHVAAAMEKHSFNESIQRDGCAILSNCAVNIEDQSVSIVPFSEMKAVVEAFKNHRQSIPVICAALFVLKNYTFDVENCRTLLQYEGVKELIFLAIEYTQANSFPPDAIENVMLILERIEIFESSSSQRQVEEQQQGDQTESQDITKDNNDSLDNNFTKLYDRIMVMETNPQVCHKAKLTGIHACDNASHQGNFDWLEESLHTGQEFGIIDIDIEHATKGRFHGFFLQDECHVLHLSCLSSKQSIKFECRHRPMSIQNLQIPLEPSQLKADIATGGRGKLVVVCCRRAFEVGTALAEAGVSHVVCCHTDEKFPDTETQEFLKEFYRRLPFDTVKEAFSKAITHCDQLAFNNSATTTSSGSARPLFKFIMLPMIHADDDDDENNNINGCLSTNKNNVPCVHDKKMFFMSGKTFNTGLTKVHCDARHRSFVKTQVIPPVPRSFTGRGLDMFHLFCAFSHHVGMSTTVKKNFPVHVTGGQGCGKSTVVAAFCKYVLDRPGLVLGIDNVIWCPNDDVELKKQNQNDKNETSSSTLCCASFKKSMQLRQGLTEKIKALLHPGDDGWGDGIYRELWDDFCESLYQVMGNRKALLVLEQDYFINNNNDNNNNEKLETLTANYNLLLTNLIGISNLKVITISSTGGAVLSSTAMLGGETVYIGPLEIKAIALLSARNVVVVGGEDGRGNHFQKKFANSLEALLLSHGNNSISVAAAATTMHGTTNAPVTSTTTTPSTLPSTTSSSMENCHYDCVQEEFLDTICMGRPGQIIAATQNLSSHNVTKLMERAEPILMTTTSSTHHHNGGLYSQIAVPPMVVHGAEAAGRVVQHTQS